MVAARSAWHPAAGHAGWRAAAQAAVGSSLVAAHSAANTAGALHPERGVRPALVVVLAPVADHDARLGQAGELLDVEQLVADAGVEATRRTGSATASRAR